MRRRRAGGAGVRGGVVLLVLPTFACGVAGMLTMTTGGKITSLSNTKYVALFNRRHAPRNGSCHTSHGGDDTAARGAAGMSHRVLSTYRQYIVWFPLLLIQLD